MNQQTRIFPFEETPQSSGAQARVGTETPEPSRTYPSDFQVTEAYKATLPDLQNGPASLIRGKHTAIQHVGISNFRLPLTFQKRDGTPVSLETSVTGTVSLAADNAHLL